MTDAYALAGVNIKAGDELSTIAAKLCRASWEFSDYAGVFDFGGGFRALRTLTLKNLPEGWQPDLAPDGLGTKPILYDAAGSYLGAGRDLVAMTAGDLWRRGMLPIALTNQLDLRTTGKRGSPTRKAAEQIYEGIYRACLDASMVMFKGETAEMGSCVGSEIPDPTCAFLLSGVSLGLADPQRLITGDALAAGQPVVALREKGFRCNGISAVRRGLKLQYGEAWWNNPAARRDIEAAAEPSVSYEDLFRRANGWGGDERIDITFIAHLTGGSIRDKFFNDEVACRNFSAQLHDLFPPPQIMRSVAEWTTMRGMEGYTTFNGGQGALVVLKDNKALSEFMRLAMLRGFEVRMCGRIERATGTPTLTINSMYDGIKLTYEAGAH